MTDRLNNLLIQLYTRLQREEGQGTTEYAIVLAAVVVVAAALAAIFTPSLKNSITNLGTSISSAFSG